MESGQPANVFIWTVVMLVYLVFCSCDLDLDLMTLIYEDKLDFLKMY